MRKLYLLCNYVGTKFWDRVIFLSIYCSNLWKFVLGFVHLYKKEIHPRTQKTGNHIQKVMHQNRAQKRQQWFWFIVIAYSTHDFCLLYIGKFAVASLSCLPEASLLNSQKRGYAGSGCRSCIYPNKIHPPFINNFSGHIYDFGQPIFILGLIMRPYYVWIWSVATLSARLKDKLCNNRLFQLFLPSLSTFSRSPVWLVATPHAAVTSAGCASKRSAGTNVKAIGNFRAARRAKGAAVPGQRAHLPFYLNIRTQQDHQQKSSFLC